MGIRGRNQTFQFVTRTFMFPPADKRLPWFGRAERAGEFWRAAVGNAGKMIAATCALTFAAKWTLTRWPFGCHFL